MTTKNESSSSHGRKFGSFTPGSRADRIASLEAGGCVSEAICIQDVLRPGEWIQPTTTRQNAMRSLSNLLASPVDRVRSIFPEREYTVTTGMMHDSQLTEFAVLIVRRVK